MDNIKINLNKDDLELIHKVLSQVVFGKIEKEYIAYKTYDVEITLFDNEMNRLNEIRHILVEKIEKLNNKK